MTAAGDWIGQCKDFQACGYTTKYDPLKDKRVSQTKKSEIQSERDREQSQKDRDRKKQRDKDEEKARNEIKARKASAATGGIRWFLPYTGCKQSHSQPSARAESERQEDREWGRI